MDLSPAAFGGQLGWWIIQFGIVSSAMLSFIISVSGRTALLGTVPDAQRD
jgi:hypothetical protein